MSSKYNTPDLPLVAAGNSSGAACVDGGACHVYSAVAWQHRRIGLQWPRVHVPAARPVDRRPQSSPDGAHPPSPDPRRARAYRAVLHRGDALRRLRHKPRRPDRGACCVPAAADAPFHPPPGAAAAAGRHAYPHRNARGDPRPWQRRRTAGHRRGSTPALDPYDPATVRATMGAQFGQRFVRTSIDELRDWHGRRHFSLVGTAPQPPRTTRRLTSAARRCCCWATSGRASPRSRRPHLLHQVRRLRGLSPLVGSPAIRQGRPVRVWGCGSHEQPIRRAVLATTGIARVVPPKPSSCWSRCPPPDRVAHGGR